MGLLYVLPETYQAPIDGATGHRRATQSVWVVDGQAIAVNSVIVSAFGAARRRVRHLESR
jgi:hypothetical protein